MSRPERILSPADEPAAPVWRTAHTALVLDVRRSGDSGEVRDVRLLVTPAPEDGAGRRGGCLAERLRAIGRSPTGPVDQVRSWCISSVLRAPTATGDVYCV